MPSSFLNILDDAGYGSPHGRVENLKFSLAVDELGLDTFILSATLKHKILLKFTSYDLFHVGELKTWNIFHEERVSLFFFVEPFVLQFLHFTLACNQKL